MKFTLAAAHDCGRYEPADLCPPGGWRIPRFGVEDYRVFASSIAGLGDSLALYTRIHRHRHTPEDLSPSIDPGPGDGLSPFIVCLALTTPPGGKPGLFRKASSDC